MRFEHKVAIITGSSDGIGKATARLLAKEGAKVAINGRSVEKLEIAAREIGKVGQLPLIVAGDICLSETVDRLVQTTIDNWGRIDILVNNAGGGSPNWDFELLDEAEWASTIDRNLTSVFRCCHRVVPIMKQQQSGRIVNVSSLAGRRASILAGAQYAAAKAGAIGFTRHLAATFGADNIAVNAVAPGIITTERALKKWEKRSPAERAQILAAIPLGRLGTIDDIAEAIAFLASDAAAYITGATLDVNGGHFMG